MAIEEIRLGLIGDNIRESRAPDLHRYCGQLAGLNVSYELLIPKDLNMEFDQVFDLCRRRGLRGINVTLPYKEKVLSRILVENTKIKQIGAVNTVLFSKTDPLGFNTDYSGFIAAYRAHFGMANPGRVMLIGAGGVGKAIAFGLTELAADEIILVDREIGKADLLAKIIAKDKRGSSICRVGSIGDVAHADGVINCTPLGMFGYPGSPIPDGEFPADIWAFDAVYTPMETTFRAQAEAAGANFLSGYELFFHQGIQAFEIFTGVKPSKMKELRNLLESSPPVTPQA